MRRESCFKEANVVLYLYEISYVHKQAGGRYICTVLILQVYLYIRIEDTL